MARYAKVHKIRCFWPGCNVLVVGRAKSNKSQQDADEKAEEDAKRKFEEAEHNHK